MHGRWTEVAHHPFVQTTMVFVVALVVFFTQLGGSRLWDEDEPKNAACAREMLRRGDWVTPRFNDGLRTAKPVLLYWVMLAAYAVGGASEFTARCGTAAAATATCLVTFALGRMLFTGRVGLWSGLGLASCVMYVASGRAATPDGVLIICTTGALALFVHSQRRLDGPGMVAPARQVTWRHAAGIYVALGLAMLAKGPVGFVLPAGVIGLYLVASERAAAAGRPRADGTWAGWARALALASWDEAMALPGAVLRGAGRMRLMSGLALALAVALPWYVWVWQRTDGAWIEGFFLHHNRDRMLKSLEGHSGPVWYYVPAVLLGFFPWSLCLAPALYFGWKSPATEEQASHRFLLVWLVGYLGVFSVAATKLPSYVLPCYPALALVVGWWMDRWADEATQFVRRSQRSAFIALAAVGLGLCVGLPITLGVFLPGEEWLGVVGLVPLVAGLLGWVELRRERLAGARWCFVGGAVLFCWLLFGFAAGPVSVRQNAPHLSALVRSWTGPTTAVATYHYSSPGLVFYTREREEAPAVRFFDDADQLAAFWAENLDATVITRSERLAELEPHLPAGVQVLAQERRFLRDDDVIVLGRPPMARADWPVRR